MPKSVQELQQRQRPLDEQVLEFLERDPTNAYTALEIAARLRGGADPNVVSMLELSITVGPDERRKRVLAGWVAVLDQLHNSGQVRSFTDGDTVYYAYSGKR